jgi:hypothetical protein
VHCQSILAGVLTNSPHAPAWCIHGLQTASMSPVNTTFECRVPSYITSVSTSYRGWPPLISQALPSMLCRACQQVLSDPALAAVMRVVVKYISGHYSFNVQVGVN